MMCIRQQCVCAFTYVQATHAHDPSLLYGRMEMSIWGPRCKRGRGGGLRVGRELPLRRDNADFECASRNQGRLKGCRQS